MQMPRGFFTQAAARKERFARFGATSLEVYHEVSAETLPDLILVLDSFASALTAQVTREHLEGDGIRLGLSCETARTVLLQPSQSPFLLIDAGSPMRFEALLLYLLAQYRARGELGCGRRR